MERPLGIDLAIFLFLSKKVPKRMAIPLITQGNLAHMVDERWVTALPFQIPLPVPTLSSSELLQGISEICAKITKMKLTTTNLSGNQPDAWISNGQKGMKTELSAGMPDSSDLVNMMIIKISPLPNPLGITPNGQVIASDTIDEVLKIPSGKVGVAPDAMPLTK